MAKQYKTWELIKAWQEGERGEFKAYKNSIELSHIVQLRDNCIMLNDSPFYLTVSAVEENLFTFVKVQEPVTFMEAINSGKKFKPFGDKYSYAWASEWIDRLNNKVFNTALELINGKWLIEDA